MPSKKTRKTSEKPAKLEEDEILTEEEINLEDDTSTSDPALDFRFALTHFILQNNLPFSLSERVCKFIQQLLSKPQDLQVLKHTPVTEKNVRCIAQNALASAYEKVT